MIKQQIVWLKITVHVAFRVYVMYALQQLVEVVAAHLLIEGAYCCYMSN